MASCHRPEIVAHSWEEVHGGIIAALRSRLATERDPVANLANAAAIVYRGFNNYQARKANWVGFYLQRGTDLVLGPFQGACRWLAESCAGVCVREPVSPDEVAILFTVLRSERPRSESV